MFDSDLSLSWEDELHDPGLIPKPRESKESRDSYEVSLPAIGGSGFGSVGKHGSVGELTPRRESHATDSFFSRRKSSVKSLCESIIICHLIKICKIIKII